jgi:hypothetical protein
MVLVQDLSSRSVSWPVFPLLAICGFSSQMMLAYPLSEVLEFTIFNLLFLVMQFLFIRIYFLITRGKYTIVLDNLIGWGDVLFILCVTFFLPVITFITFYVFSLVLVLAGWLLYLQVTKVEEKHIPLAGLQALVLSLVLAGDWFFGRYDVYDDRTITYLIR